MLPTTVSRVPEHTAPHVNAEIRRRTAESVARHAAAGPEAIGRRLAELDREWDIERTLTANAGTVVLLGLALGRLVHRNWWLLSATSAAFLIHHALQGWCPPVVWFRRLGIRTAAEIEEERSALKALRGDFENLPAIAGAEDGRTVHTVLEAVRRR